MRRGPVCSAPPLAAGAHLGQYTGFVRLTWPLTGRTVETGIIEAAVSAGDLCGITIYGAAGVGKTRVAREALFAAPQRREIRWAVATSSARGLPLGALAAWAPSAPSETLHLVGAVTESLTRAPAATQVVLCVDDAHLLDELSAFVLHQIVQRGAAKLVLTIREGEPIPTAVSEIWKAGHFDRLDLQPLSREETATLVAAALEGPVHPDAARRLWKLTRGNVLFVRNIVEQERADGRLVQHHGYWTWQGEPVLAPGLLETIESRIGALPPSVGDVIDALAVGEPLELTAVTSITSAAAVEEAESRGLITLDQIDDAVQVRVAHPLYGEVRRRRAPSTRLRRLRGLVAAQLAAADDRDDMSVLVRRATLSLQSDLAAEPELYLRAAQGALWLADLNLAERLGEAAIRTGAPAEAAFIRGHALGWLGRGREADVVLADVSARCLSDAERSRLAFMRASNALFSLGDPQGAKALIEEAEPVIPPDARGCIDAFLTVYWAVMGQAELATQSAKSLVLDELPGIVGVETAGAIAIAAGLAGRAGEAEAAAAAGYALVTRTFDAFHMRFWVADAHTTALALAGRITEATTISEQLSCQSAELPGAAPLLATAMAGRAGLYAGDLLTACALLETAVELLLTGETYHLAYRHQLPLAIAFGMRGATTDAATVLATLDERADPAWRHVDYERTLAQAWLAASQGLVSEATSRALSAAGAARARGQFAAEVICLQTATQFGDRSCAARLRELAGSVEGPRAQLAARLAAALCDGDGSELALASMEFERIGDRVAALDCAAHAAIAYRSHGLRGSALGCSARADNLAEGCGAVTPALRRASEPVPLSDREREVITLIGAGMSNRAIADRLTLSVRTIESHIYRAMIKTGAGSRSELATLIPRRLDSAR